jgi:hypothetical protein
VLDRVAEFARQYPDRANRPICESDGRALRRRVTDAERKTEYVEPANDWEDGHQVETQVRREATTWEDALHAFLHAHERYDELTARFDDGDGDTFEIDLDDAWGTAYAGKQYARAKAVQREMSGGERPSGGDTSASWGDTVTAMLTLTGTSRPDGQPVAPVDHMDALHDAWSYGGVRDTLRNTMEYHLGLDSDQWGYWLQAEPHGAGDAAAADETPGVNACHTHLHVAVYADFDAIAHGPEQIEDELGRVVQKHVDECDLAGEDAHDDAIEVRQHLDNMGDYMAAYVSADAESLLDRPIEYLAWGALYWAASRRRCSRSQTVTHAITADRCRQRAESDTSDQDADHGERLERRDGHGYDVVCACCGSGWRVDQDALDDATDDDDLRDAIEDGDDDQEDDDLDDDQDDGPTFAELWSDADRAHRVGESIRRAEARDAVRQWVDRHGEPDSTPELLARLDLDPALREFVDDVLDGAPVPTETARSPPTISTEWDLVAIVDGDGEEHLPGGGGVDTVELDLPVDRLIDGTRLGVFDDDPRKGETPKCALCNVSHHTVRTMAAHLHREHGITNPDVADRALVVTDHRENDRPAMRPPADAVESPHRTRTPRPTPDH